MVATVTIQLDQAHTLLLLSEMYKQLGGVPRRTTSDNPKVFTTCADRYEPVIHPLYERFAYHYGTTVECLPPRAPTKKGKVERPIPYIRRLLEAYDGDKADLTAIKTYLTKKLAIANTRRHGSTYERPIDRFLNEERKHLLPLPSVVYEQEYYHEGTVRLDGHVRFLGKYYSVSEEYIHKEVTIIGNSSLVWIYHKGVLLETHERVLCRTRTKSTKLHHLKPWEQECADPDGLRGEARKIGPCVEHIVQKILENGAGFINFRRIWGVLSLAKKYSPEEIDSACEHAYSLGITSSKALEEIILTARASNDPEDNNSPRPEGKFQRDISEYTQVLLAFTKPPRSTTYEH